MTDVGRNETVRLEDDPRATTFEDHSAFSRTSFIYIDPELPYGHLASHDATLKTMPTPFDRTNADDVDRTQEDLMIQLAGEVDQHCLNVLLDASGIQVDDIAPADIDEWIRRTVLDVRLETRSGCGIDVLFDTELAPLVTTAEGEGPRHVDLGWRRANIYTMYRHAPMHDGLYIVVNQQHVIGLSSRVSLFFSSHSLDADSEYLSARCDLAYRPRLDFHPGAVRIARVTFPDEQAWKAAARTAVQA